MSTETNIKNEILDIIKSKKEDGITPESIVIRLYEQHPLIRYNRVVAILDDLRSEGLVHEAWDDDVIEKRWFTTDG